jgi:hypothetical protein
MFQAINNIFTKVKLITLLKEKGINLAVTPKEILRHNHKELRKSYKIAYQRSTLKLYETLLRADKINLNNNYIPLVHAKGQYCDLVTPKNISIGCIDERCQCNNKVSISLAGCGALLENDELYTRCEDILKECDEIGVETIGVSGHAGCGAATLAIKTGLLDGTGKTAKEIELYFAKRATDVLQNIVSENNYKIIVKEASYQDVCDMLYIEGSDTSQLHPAMGILVDLQHLNQSPRINPQTFLSQNQLPYFLISDTGNKLDDFDEAHKSHKFVSTVRTIDLAAVIAQGDHGMGSDYSLPVIFLTQNDSEINRAKDIIPELEEQLAYTEFGKTEKKYLFAIVDAR